MAIPSINVSEYFKIKYGVHMADMNSIFNGTPYFMMVLKIMQISIIFNTAQIDDTILLNHLKIKKGKSTKKLSK